MTFKIFDNITENEGLIIEIENVESEEYKKLFNVWLDMPGNEQHERLKQHMDGYLQIKICKEKYL